MVKQSIVKRMTRISPVWIVPLIAFVIAVWLAVQAQMSKGTQIEITFAKASDIIPGQTQIRLKDVQVGSVKSLRLSKDLSSVIVTAEIDRAVSRHLSKSTRFWVVTPRISAKGVSNLGTLISGVYIVMDPGPEGATETSFRGLDETPILQSSAQGTHYVLQADTLGSLDIGSPVYYRQIRVGEVTGYRLAENQQHVDINFFIRAPHDQMVQQRSRFWDVSGFGVSLGAEGMKAKMASLTSLIAGGIEFGNGSALGDETPAEQGHRFYLYPDKESVLEERFTIKHHFLLRFSDTVRGLAVGAPVEFRGIKVGEVVDVKLDNASNNDNSLHVYIAIAPQRFSPDHEPSREEFDAQLKSMVEQGLRANMATASLLTGAKYIELGFTDEGAGELVVFDDYSELPSAPAGEGGIEGKIDNILAQVEQIPFEQIGKDLASGMASLKQVMGTLEQQNTAHKIDGAMAGLEQSMAKAHLALAESEKLLENFNQILAPDAQFRHEMSSMLESVSDASRSMQLFLDELNRHPQALIYGADKDE
ncbi:intermembrane transport protein PqiB [Agaribacterium haliotis]|uniref:PqiB family protein n=1 Tax=Agaribacterium haliotis TaxID=2013869 RepID=UPI000BB532E2|nr:MlaD family protein [Agaribacterium haliotis]